MIMTRTTITRTVISSRSTLHLLPAFPRRRKDSVKAEVAERAGVTTATVARAERDELEPRMTTLRKLAVALEVDPAELVRGE
jgi:transcriptional regulator with XRE-family HTH domain